MLSLDSPISSLSGIGSAMMAKLAKLGINTLGQAVQYYPFRYDNFSQQTTISQIVVGATVNLVGTVDIISTKRSPRRRMYLTEAIINDGTGQLRLIWFNQPFLTRNIHEGDRLSVAGKISQDMLGVVMASPQYEKVGQTEGGLHTQGLVPVYRTVSGISTKQLRSIIDQALKLVDLADWLPASMISQRGLWPLTQALAKIHHPDSLASINKARQRLAFDELLLLQLRGQLTRQAWLTHQAPSIQFNQALTKQVLASWPFQLTDDQRRCAWQILQDLSHEQPMLRLLQGDVGSGKTAVAMLAMLNVAVGGYQAALLAPSEVLASQHFQSLVQAIGQHCSIGLLTRTQQAFSQSGQVIDKITKVKLISQIASGDCQLVIGTQALLQEKISFHHLALLVVDEQQRFGVEQRQLLLNKKLFHPNDSKLVPHFLAMTATPIPRSLALTLYGDLSLSVIKEMPAGRLPVITKVITAKQRQSMYQLVRQLLGAGQQAFIVCPLIDESDKLTAKAVTTEFETLTATELAGYKVGLLHGRLSSADKQTVMADFAAGRLQALVATAVIELGIDVPGATVMIIESAERFGLAQLHQYRGRVGRRGQQAYCFLLSDDHSDLAQKRLAAVAQYHNGQELAKLDLAWRGPGELYGRAQTGFADLRLASIFDQELIIMAKKTASEILAKPAWRQTIAARLTESDRASGWLPQ
ncbi:MAG TPA: ATP-dependent DNA helicase RecG [bacterium]|jgi:ATP-dependent DNA helicase RecG|nr:ATP-dependent DNA helicase RecG [bacterium]HOH85667.1 ATP-dependent DNA helicase RecG [bacterium]